jgi:RNA polymerase sigma-70 factor (ECF subfamily)
MDETAHPEDGLDIEPLRRRSPDAVAAWFDAFSDAIYTFVFYRVGRDRDLAADVTQDTFVTALRTIGRYDPARGAMFPWLTYIARNAIRKTLRHSRRYQPLDALWVTIDERLVAGLRTLDDTPLPESVVERQETGEIVRMALSQIAPAHQRIIGEHYFRERSIKDMAETVQTSEGAIKVRLHRARLAFKTAFEAVIAALADRRPARRIRS